MAAINCAQQRWCRLSVICCYILELLSRRDIVLRGLPKALIISRTALTTARRSRITWYWSLGIVFVLLLLRRTFTSSLRVKLCHAHIIRFDFSVTLSRPYCLTGCMADAALVDLQHAQLAQLSINGSNPSCNGLHQRLFCLFWGLLFTLHRNWDATVWSQRCITYSHKALSLP